MNLCWQKSIYD
uniref:Early nodulin-40-2 n=1 Tax=Medicago truncatula TaxID=3880 RepID=NO40B_MEDTR|nr:RecName: Full=Early nodulin-40-2 [Medicago truncatula]